MLGLREVGLCSNITTLYSWFGEEFVELNEMGWNCKGGCEISKYSVNVEC